MYVKFSTLTFWWLLLHTKYADPHFLTSNKLMVFIQVHVMTLNIAEKSLLAVTFVLHIKFMTLVMDFDWFGFRDMCMIVIWELRNVKAM